MESIGNFSGFTDRQKEINKIISEKIRQKALEKLKMSRAEKIYSFIILGMIGIMIISFIVLNFIDLNSKFATTLSRLCFWSMILSCIAGFVHIVVFGRRYRN